MSCNTCGVELSCCSHLERLRLVSLRGLRPLDPGARILGLWRMYKDLNASGDLRPSVYTGLNALQKIS